MKFLILGALAFVSVSAFAQHSPASVCQEISRYSGQYGAECATALSRGRFDNTVIEVAFSIAQTGAYSSATKVMSMSPNRYLDDDVAGACIAVARFSGEYAAKCVEVALDNAFTPALAAVAQTIATTGAYSSATAAVGNAANGYAHPGAAEVSKAVARFSGDYAARCVSAILNKDYYNDAESVCLTLANQGSYSSAVTCMQNSGVSTNQRPSRRHRDWDINNGQVNPGQYHRPDNRPDNRPDRNEYSVNVSRIDIDELARSISKARAQYDRRNYRQMDATLIDLQRKIDEIKASMR
jgi:hypothetical protein